MNFTEYLKLNLPTQETVVDIDDLNENNIKIDLELKKINRSLLDKDRDISNINQNIKKIEDDINNLDIPEDVDLRPINSRIDKLESGKAERYHTHSEYANKIKTEGEINRLDRKIDSIDIPEDVDLRPINNRIDKLESGKANKYHTHSEYADKTKTESEINRLDKKIDTIDIPEDVDLRPIADRLDKLESGKANKSHKHSALDIDETYSRKFVSSSQLDDIKKIGEKADKTYVDTEVGKKADKTYVDKEIDKKADKTYVDTEIDKKADKKGSATGVASFVLASHIASDEVKEKADYVLDKDEDASPVINKWSKHLTSSVHDGVSSSGVIQLSEGIFHIKTPLMIYGGTTLQGVYNETELLLEVSNGEVSLQTGLKPSSILYSKTIIKDVVFNHHRQRNKAGLQIKSSYTTFDGIFFFSGGSSSSGESMKIEFSGGVDLTNSICSDVVFYLENNSVTSLITNNVFGERQGEIKLIFTEEHRGVFAFNILVKDRVKVINESKYSFPYEYNIETI